VKLVASFDYDSKTDSLYIYRKNENVKFSINIQGDFIIDINGKRKAVGLEVLNASKNLLPKSFLKEIKKADIRTVIRDGFFGVKFRLMGVGPSVYNYNLSVPMKASAPKLL